MGQANARGTFERRRANPKGNPVIEPCVILVMPLPKPRLKHSPARTVGKLKRRKNSRYGVTIVSGDRKALVYVSKQRGSRGFRQCSNRLETSNHPLAHLAQIGPVTE